MTDKRQWWITSMQTGKNTGQLSLSLVVPVTGPNDTAKAIEELCAALGIADPAHVEEEADW